MNPLQKFVQLSTAIEPRQIVFHPGFAEFRFAFREELWLENSLKVWGELLEAASRINTRVCLENVFDTRPDHLVKLKSEYDANFGDASEREGFGYVQVWP